MKLRIHTQTATIAPLKFGNFISLLTMDVIIIMIIIT